MQERFFYFAQKRKKKRESFFLTLTFSSFLLLLSILLVLVSVLCFVYVAGRYCFRLIATVDIVVVFVFSLTFTHAVHFIANKKKRRKIILHTYIHTYTYFNSFFYLCHNSSFPFPSILIVSYLSFFLSFIFFFFALKRNVFFFFFCYFPLLLLFLLYVALHTRKLECHHILKKINTPRQQNQIKTQT